MQRMPQRAFAKTVNVRSSLQVLAHKQEVLSFDVNYCETFLLAPITSTSHYWELTRLQGKLVHEATVAGRLDQLEDHQLILSRSPRKNSIVVEIPSTARSRQQLWSSPPPSTSLRIPLRHTQTVSTQQRGLIPPFEFDLRSLREYGVPKSSFDQLPKALSSPASSRSRPDPCLRNLCQHVAHSSARHDG